MSDPLPLFDMPATPKLTELQRTVLVAVTAAGGQGLETWQAGAILHSLRPDTEHTRDQLCEYCYRDGNAALKRLRKLGLVKYRIKLGAWTLTGADAPNPRGMTDEIPY